jgi:hypothetical protein
LRRARAIPPVVNSTNLNSLNIASLLQPFTDVTDHRLPLVNNDPLNPEDVTTKIGGLLPYENQLFASAYIYYDGRSSQSLSHYVSPLDLSNPGDATGPFTVNRADCDPASGQNCLGAGFFDGYFGRVPSAWQPAFGGPVINGNYRLGVIGRTSCGPALFSSIDAARHDDAAAGEAARLLPGGAPAACRASSRASTGTRAIRSSTAGTRTARCSA